MSHPAPASPAGYPYPLAELAAILGAKLAGDGARVARSYAIDSRAVSAGTVFFALKGERTDGHAFLEPVARAGAAAAVVREGSAVPAGLPALAVAEPAEALLRLGRHYRHAWPLQVIGITGSAGKTTTKEFAAGLLASCRRVFKSEGNLNSALGLPLTLARRTPEHELAVLELGMSFPGELRRLSSLARPEVAVITNIGLAHVQNFASADEVARAKSEILEGVAPGGAFVANADDARVMAMSAAFPGRTVTFGVAQPADLRATRVEPLGAEGTRFILACQGRSGEGRLSIPGAHHVRNVLAALAAAFALDVDPLALLPLASGLAAGPHRGALLRLQGEVSVLDDCYNSSPAALFHALETLATLPATRRVAIVGDMLELGSYSEASHREAGRRAARAATVVLGVGPASAALVEEAHAHGCKDVQHVPDAATAAGVVLDLVRDGDAVLVKASRGVGLEVVIEALEKARG